MPGIYSFNSNSNRLILGTCESDQRIYLFLFFKEHMGSHDITNSCLEIVRKLLVLSHDKSSCEGLFHKL